MKKHKRNTTYHTANHYDTPLAIRRETVRVLTGDELALIAGGSTTILTEKPTTQGAC